MAEENAQLLNEMFKDKIKQKLGNVTKDEIVCVVDRSGSMGSIRSDAEGGLNTFIESQQKQEGAGANFTLVEFDHDIVTVHNRVDVDTVKPYKLEPRGSTALLDAIGTAINSMPKDLDKDAKVIFVVVTDGGENASKEYKREQVFKMIDEKKALGWEFMFLAANQDAIETGSSYGFDMGKCVNFASTTGGTKALYDFVATNTSNYRTMAKSEYETAQVKLKAGLDSVTKAELSKNNTLDNNVLDNDVLDAFKGFKPDSVK